MKRILYVIPIFLVLTTFGLVTDPKVSFFISSVYAQEGEEPDEPPDEKPPEEQPPSKPEPPPDNRPPAQPTPVVEEPKKCDNWHGVKYCPEDDKMGGKLVVMSFVHPLKDDKHRAMGMSERVAYRIAFARLKWYCQYGNHNCDSRGNRTGFDLDTVNVNDANADQGWDFRCLEWRNFNPPWNNPNPTLNQMPCAGYKTLPVSNRWPLMKAADGKWYSPWKLGVGRNTQPWAPPEGYQPGPGLPGIAPPGGGTPGVPGAPGNPGGPYGAPIPWIMEQYPYKYVQAMDLQARWENMSGVTTQQIAKGGGLIITRTPNLTTSSDGKKGLQDLVDDQRKWVIGTLLFALVALAIMRRLDRHQYESLAIRSIIVLVVIIGYRQIFDFITTVISRTSGFFLNYAGPNPTGVFDTLVTSLVPSATPEWHLFGISAIPPIWIMTLFKMFADHALEGLYIVGVVLVATMIYSGTQWLAEIWLDFLAKLLCLYPTWTLVLLLVNVSLSSGKFHYIEGDVSLDEFGPGAGVALATFMLILGLIVSAILVFRLVSIKPVKERVVEKYRNWRESLDRPRLEDKSEGLKPPYSSSRNSRVTTPVEGEPRRRRL